MFKFLPLSIQNCLEKFQLNDIYEVRIRLGKPLFLRTKNGVKCFNITVDKTELAQTFLRLTEHSIYAHIDSLKQGYITTKKGLRVGVCGECVKEDDKIKIVKELSSLCIRIPHEIKGVSQTFVDKYFNGEIQNIIIISPPSGGKTTFLRDIVRYLSYKYNYNILVVDERLEISSLGAFDLGSTVDVLSYSSKEYGFYQGVKSMSPQIIATDELSNENDVKSVIDACFSGVNVIATAHSKNLSTLKRREIFAPIFNNCIFDYAVILGDEGRFMKVEKLNG